MRASGLPMQPIGPIYGMSRRSTQAYCQLTEREWEENVLVLDELRLSRPSLRDELFGFGVVLFRWGILALDYFLALVDSQWPIT
jgi:hypothetical protein